MSSYTIPTLKSPKSSNSDVKKLPISPKLLKSPVKVEHHTVNLFNDPPQVSKPSRTETKARLEIKTSPVNSGSLSLHKSRSPGSIKNDDQVSRLSMIKEHLSPTSHIEKSSIKSKKETNQSFPETQNQEIVSKEIPTKLTARITINKSKGTENNLSGKKSPPRTTPKSEPGTPVESKPHKRLGSGVPVSAKLHDIEEEKTLAKAVSSIKIGTEKTSPQKEKKKNKSELISRINPKISIQPSVVVTNKGGSTQRLLSPQSQSNINRRLRNETPVNTGRQSVQSLATPKNTKVSKNIEDETVQESLDVIKEQNNNVESRNGSCSPSSKNEASEKKASRNRKLNLVIPTVQISTDELSEVKVTRPSTTRAMFYNVDVTREDSPQPNGNKSARLIKALVNASVDRLEDKSKDLDQLSLFPSRNSEFSFPMKYFKPIEDSTLDQYIQTVNDSQKLKVDSEAEHNSTKLSHESKRSPLKTDKSLKELTKSRVSTPALLVSPSMSSLSTKEKPVANSATIHARHLSPQSALRSTPGPRVSETKGRVQGNKDEQLKHNFSPVVEQKVRMRSPIKKWEQAIPKSPPRNQPGIITNHAQRTSIDSKDGLSFIKNSFSRQYPKLAEEMESIPIEMLRTKGNKTTKNIQADNKFSNLDKLLAQLRTNSKAKIEASLPETEDSEKGLFDPSIEPEDESMNMSINRSFARTFIKFSSNNPS